MGWKQVKVYPSLLNDNNILFDESYFKKTPKEMRLSVHSMNLYVTILGYRLNLQKRIDSGGEKRKLGI